MHVAAYEYVAKVVAEFGLTGDVLDLGGRDVNGSVRELFNPDRYVTVDIVAAPSVDIVADAADLDLDELFDVAISTECFEHTPSGPEIVATAYRHLRPGGIFVATMAGPGRAPHGASGQPLPPPGEWYRNVDADELAEWLSDAGFDEHSIDVAGEDVRCWAKR